MVAVIDLQRILIFRHILFVIISSVRDVRVITSKRYSLTTVYFVDLCVSDSTLSLHLLRFCMYQPFIASIYVIQSQH